MIPALLAVGAAGCLAYGALYEVHDFRVRRFTVPVLPPGSQRLRLLHLSDLHLLPSQARRLDFLRSLVALRPDLVISTGDHISSSASLHPLEDALGPLLDTPGAFVFGSNDYKAPSFKNPLRYLWTSSRKDRPSAGELPAQELARMLSARGWCDLNNNTGELSVKGVRIALRGTDDAHEHRDSYDAVAGPAVPGALNLGVTHAPYRHLLDAMTTDGVDLILAGHTHGGQVCVPGFGALITNCDLPREHARGLFENEAHGHTSSVHVSAGLGTSPYAPYRFACRPEVSLLVLTPRPE